MIFSVEPRQRSALLVLICALCACAREDSDIWQGYVEGDYVRMAAAAPGRITTIAVVRGQQVAAGAPLFTLDAEHEQAAVTEAEHRLGAAQARLADLGKGRRPEELEVIRAQLQQAQVQLTLAQAQLQRQTELLAKGLSSAEQLDLARAQSERAAAAVQESRKQLQAAELAGRADAIAAAREDAGAAQALLAQARWQLAQKTVSAPAPGLIEDMYYRAGEWAAAGAPVVSLLPPQNRKLRFFVPEPALGKLKPGQTLQARCDGCGEAFAVTISFIATQAEFTPPVLYGREHRSRLVYLVEAVAGPADALRLHPGQPVDVLTGP